jgi:ABC-2 type transport system permease protein
LGAQVRADVRSNLRLPEFVVGAVSVPIILFVMFGSAEAGDVLPGGTPVPAMMAVSFAAYGIVSLAIFTFGIDVAQERGSGWLRTRRVTPLPAWSYFAGKIAMALVFAILIVLGIMVAAVVLIDVALAVGTWLRVVLLLLVGTVAFSTFGFAMAYLVRPRAASAIGNLIFLPLSFASGFFFPLDELPASVRDLAPYLPTYHFGRLVWAQLGAPEDVAAWSGNAVAGVGVADVVWVAGCFIVCGVLALVGYRRDAARTLG